MSIIFYGQKARHEDKRGNAYVANNMSGEGYVEQIYDFFFFWG